LRPRLPSSNFVAILCCFSSKNRIGGRVGASAREKTKKNLSVRKHFPSGADNPDRRKVSQGA
jgi:hypothetical protein